MKESSLLKEISTIAKTMYEVADTIETKFADEKWRTASKLKNAANDAYFYTAQVVGAGDNQALEFDCINARKSLNALRAMYIFASKQNMAELEPATVLKIDSIISEIDAVQVASQDEIKRKTEEELMPWLEKYKIWQKISKD
jgi:hypothetical protein